jgi:hypothetical protein
MICNKKKETTEARLALREVAKAHRLAPSGLPTEPPEQNVDGLICWWCVHALPQKPCIHLPVRYDDRLDRFTTTGNFCSWQCAKAYALDMGTAKSGEIQSILSLMRLKAFGKFVPLWPAPKRQFLKCFGGTMTIEEFRSYGGQVEPPQIYFPIEKQIQPIFSNTPAETVAQPSASFHTVDSTRLKAIENSTSQQETLKLKRNKPLARTASKLESTLGIVRKPK